MLYREIIAVRSQDPHKTHKYSCVGHSADMVIGKGGGTSEL
jgi:hypothetical protein